MENTNGSLNFQATIDIKQLQRDMSRMKQEFVSMSASAQKEGGKTQNIMSNLMKGAAAYFSIRQAAQFASQIVSVRGEFQQLAVAFETMLGSKEKADTLMAQVVDFAAKTPFQLTEVAQGTKQLLAYRIESENIIPTLKALGDVSAGLSVPIGRLILNYGQVKTAAKLTGRELRDFNMAGVPLLSELAKNLGTTEKAVGEMVSAGKIGFKDVEQAFRTMSSEGGRFADLMDKQSATITGRISNLQDSVEKMMNDIGQSSEGVINTSIDAAGYLVENYEEIGRQIGGLIVLYGSYRAALMVTSAVQFAVTASTIGMTNAEIAHYSWLVLSQKAQKALNATALLNPYVAVAAALAGLVYVMYQFATSQTISEVSTTKFNKKMQDRIDLAAKEEAALRENMKTLKSATISRTQQQDALEKLQRKYPKYFSNLDIEKAKLIDVSEVLQEVNERMETKNNLSDAEKLKSLKNELALTKSDPNRVNKLNNVTTKNKLANGNLGGGIASMFGIGDVTQDEYLDKLNEDIKLYEDKLTKVEKLKFNALSAPEKSSAKNVENVALKAELLLLGESKGAFDIINNARREGLKDLIIQNEQLIRGYNEVINKNEAIRSQLMVSKEISEKEAEIKKLQLKSVKGITAKEKEELTEAKEALSTLNSELELLSGKKPKKTPNEKYDVNDILQVEKQNKRNIEDLVYSSELRKIQIQEDGTAKSLALLKFDGDQKLIMLQRQKDDAVLNMENDAEKDKKLNPNYNAGTWQKQITEYKKAWDSAMISQTELNASNNSAFLKDKYASDLNQYSAFLTSYISKKGEFDQELKNLEAKGYTPDVVASAKKVQDSILEKMAVEMDIKEIAIVEMAKSLIGLGVEDILKQFELASELLKTELAKGDGEANKSTITALQAKIKALETSLKSKTNEEVKATNLQDFKATIGLLNDVRQATTAVIESFSGLSDETKEVLSSMMNVTGSVLQMISGIAQLANFSTTSVKLSSEGASAAIIAVEKASVILAIISAALQITMAIFNLIAANKDKQKEKEIQKLQLQVDALKKSYTALGKEIEKAYATDAVELIKQQDAKLRAQKELIEQQIAEERKKKKTDNNKIKAYEQAIDDINDQLNETEVRQIDAINGTSVQSAIDDFASAYMDAWSAGEDKAKAMKDVVRDMIKASIAEMVKMRMSGEVENFMTYLSSAMMDGVLTASEKAILNAMENNMVNMMESMSNTLDEYVLDEAVTDDRKASESKGFGSMSQDSADELNGRFATLQAHTFAISDSIKILQANSAIQLKHLAGIETNTASLVRLEKIEKDMSSVKSGLDQINDKGITIRR
jgi:tape measure domain-containing protein